MRILNRYILHEVFSHSLVGLVVFTFIVYVPHLGQLLELVVRHNLPGLSVLSLFLAPVPAILVITIPMAVLVGTLIGLSRMAADGEVIAARAVGIGVGHFVRPVMIYAFCGWLVASIMSLWLAPRAAAHLNHLENELRASQAAYAIQPRVFIEEFPNLLVYISDIAGPQRQWRGVFIADMTDRTSPKVTLAQSGQLVNDGRGGLVLHLEHGTTHEVDPQHAERYSIASFTATDLPVPPPASASGAAEQRSPVMQTLGQLAAGLRQPRQKQAALVELNYRFGLPVAALVLPLVGIPLGLFSRKGGKAVGVMLTIALVFAYYILMALGLSLSKQGRLSPFIGLWEANVFFAVVGALMLANLRWVRLRWQTLQEGFVELRRWFGSWQHGRAATTAHTRSRRHAPGSRLFQILDLYVVRGWIFYFLLLLVAFSGVYIVFDFFQILGDAIRNHAAPSVVLNYYRYLSPQVIYLMLPLSILVATLVNFSLLAKTNQITAIKAAGISLYRISMPILLLALLLSAGMFMLGDNYLPETNQRQSAFRNEIKGKPPQTYFRPDRQWIFGEGNRIFNYRFFDADHDVFASVSVFEFDPHSFQLTRRIYAGRAFWEPQIGDWVFEDGWERDLKGDRVTAYSTFPVSTFPEVTEPPSYFKKEVRTSEQMSAFELRSYIHELSQSGVDVVPLRVQFYRKFSYPLIAFVVGLIGVPFSFSAGRKGALTGVGLSIGIAIAYWSVSSLFEAMGNLSQLPPAVAAWAPDGLFGLAAVYLLLRVRT